MSEFGSLSSKLMAKIYPVQQGEDGSWTLKKGDTPVVGFVVGDVTLSQTANWTSPFEGAGLEGLAQNTLAATQSGVAGDFLAELGISSDLVNSLEGKSTMTQLNSTQTFSGQPPAQLPLNLRFRAVSDPLKEVEAPVLKLGQWSVCEVIPSGGLLGNIVADIKNSKLNADTVFGTKIPQFVAVELGNRFFAPMIIDSFSENVNQKLANNGDRTECDVSLNLQSLYAWDAKGYFATRRTP